MAVPEADAGGDAGSVADDVSLSKASFLCVRHTTADDLNDVQQLKLALQHAGYNPTSELLQRYWTSTTTAISFEEFDKIVQLEPLPRRLDLISYFRKLDLNADGFIRRDDLIKALNAPDDEASGNVVKGIVNDVRYQNDTGDFDYRKFCDDVFDTSARLSRLAKERVCHMDESTGINSRTYKVKKKDSSPQKSPQHRNWKCSATCKGSFFHERDVIISHQYIMQVHEEGLVDISIQPRVDCSNPVDCQLFVFKLNGDDSPTAKAQLVARTPLIPPRLYSCSMAGVRKSWAGHLESGRYLLVPSTTGCIMRKRKSQAQRKASLVTVRGEEVALTNDFKRVLSNIFNQVDLDGNGTLSRTEFNLFNWRTSGEEVQDEEWDVVRENFSLDKNELTLDGFLKLHQMEAEESKGDPAELWITLNAMGYNFGLQQDEASAFQISVKGEKESQLDLDISGLKSGGSLLDKATIKCIMQKSEKARRVDATREVFVYREDAQFRTSFVVENRSSDHIRLKMDFGQSRNVLINHPHLAFQAGISPKSTLFVAHLIADDVSNLHSVHLKDQIIFD